MLSLIQSVALIGGSFLVAFGSLLAVQSARNPPFLNAEPALKDADGNTVRIPNARRDADGFWQYQEQDGSWADYPSTVLQRNALKEADLPAPDLQMVAGASYVINPNRG